MARSERRMKSAAPKALDRVQSTIAFPMPAQKPAPPPPHLRDIASNWAADMSDDALLDYMERRMGMILPVGLAVAVGRELRTRFSAYKGASEEKRETA